MEMEEDSQHFMSMIHQKDMGMNPDDILNMNLQSILILLKLDTRALSIIGHQAFHAFGISNCPWLLVDTMLMSKG